MATKTVTKKGAKAKAEVPAKLAREEKKVLPTASADIEDTDIDTDEEEEEETPAPKIRSTRAKKEEEDIAEGDEGYDYLQKYQYKKVNNNPVLGSVAGALTDPDKGSKAEKMKAFLLSQRKITMLIPLPEGSDPKVLHSVCLNGYRLDFPTNTYLEVPEQVAEVISKSNSQTLLALSQNRIDGNSKKEDALS